MILILVEADDGTHFSHINSVITIRIIIAIEKKINTRTTNTGLHGLAQSVTEQNDMILLLSLLISDGFPTDDR